MSMRNPFKFFVELMQQPLWVLIWVTYLIAINLGSVLFWQKPLAVAVFLIFIVNSIAIIGLFSAYGYVGILGLGHLPWFPLLIYIWTQLDSFEGYFMGYLIVLSVSLVISLMFDVNDVWRYLKRNKANTG